MPISRKTTKERTSEIVAGVKCILEAQTNLKSKQECVPILKKPIHNFCQIAKQTEKRVQAKGVDYEVSRFLGAMANDRKRMGMVCSSQDSFPSCDITISLEQKRTQSDTAWQRWSQSLGQCKTEIKKAIVTKPIERSQDWSTLIRSFETMRDWMHESGYNLPDYVWVVPNNLRHNVKKVFEVMSSEKIKSPKDLEKLSQEIGKW